MTSIKTFEDIKTWNMARKLTSQIYTFSNKGAFSRDYSFRDQIRRASVSIMANIAEGFESQTQSLFITYLGRAKASAGEVRSHLYLAYDLGYLKQNEFNSYQKAAKEISRKLYRFIKYLKSQPNTPRI